MNNVCKRGIDFIKKHDNIFFILLIVLSIFGLTMNVFLASSDELWNFQSVYKMYNGYEIYKDFNVIITPLFFIFGKILFNILGANFLIFRIYNIIIISIFYFLTYLLLKELGIKKILSMIITVILIMIKNYIIILTQANYNIMALMFCILGVLFCIKKHKYNNIIQGIIVFLIFCTKQNIGIYYGLGLLLYELFQKNKIKLKIKNLIVEFLIFIILINLLLIILYTNNNLYNFINYTILGIKEFANKNIFIDISNILIIIFFIFSNLICSIIFIKNKKIKIEKSEKEKLIIMNCFSFPLILISWPIMNNIHVLLSIYLSIILFIFIINIILKKIEIKINKKIIISLLLFLIIINLGYSIYHFRNWRININYLKSEYNIEKENPLYGAVIRKETIEKINNILKYIKNTENTVIICSKEAALYMVPLKLNNGMLDLPFLGNLGENGEEGLIEKIKNINNLEILIVKDEEELLWQESKIVRKYIIENMKKIGEIENFYIYSNIENN